MIAMVVGRVELLEAPVACVMTSGGVGYEIELPIPSFCQLTLGQNVAIYTHLHVREDAHLLFGFMDKKDRDVFRKLIKINGVGAKMALAMLSTLSASELKTAVEYDDDSALVRIPGIGKKTAQRLIIELKGKLVEVACDADFVKAGELFDESSNQPSQMQVIAEVERALISLGYKEKEAQNAIKIAQEGLEQPDTSSLLKASLKQFSKS